MPQVDLETLVCGGSDRKVIACETFTHDDGDDDDDRSGPPAPPLTAAEAEDKDEDPDLPPESIEVPIGGEGIDYWASLNAVYERDDSTKGNTNPKSNHSNPNPNPRARTNVSNAKKTPIIALPGRFVLRRRRATHPPPPQPPPRPQGRIIPRAAEAGAGADPGSPEVSCFGKVLSHRDRRRPAARGGGCWAALAAALGCGGGGDTKTAEVEEEEEVVVVVGGCSARSHARDYAGNRGLKRFASGRREREGEGEGGGEGGGHVAEGGEGRVGGFGGDGGRGNSYSRSRA